MDAKSKATSFGNCSEIYFARDNLSVEVFVSNKFPPKDKREKVVLGSDGFNQKGKQ